MIYNVGDKVRIKSKEWYDENKDEDGNVNIPFLFNSEMSYYCGEITTITKIEKYSPSYPETIYDLSRVFLPHSGGLDI